MTERTPVRAKELARALRDLPHPDDRGPRIVEIEVTRYPLHARPGLSEATITTDRVRFRREIFGHGVDRWHEWVLDI